MPTVSTNPFTQIVNTYVASLLVLSFGMVATSMLLRAADMEDPITLSGMAVAEILLEDEGSLPSDSQAL
jgi:hypothetical protein